MKTLPVSADKLNFNELRNFKTFHELITVQDLPDDAPKSVKYAIQSFRFLYFYASILLNEKKFRALNRCWDDLRKRYGNEHVFGDGIAAEAWIFFNFPIAKEGGTVLDDYEKFILAASDTKTDLSPFIKAAKKSRFGLYQEALSTSRITRFRELFTEQVISTLRSVPDYKPGEIFLGRILEIDGDRFLFGDPTCFPADRKQSLIDMITDKLVAYLYAFNTSTGLRSVLVASGKTPSMA